MNGRSIPWPFPDRYPMLPRGKETGSVSRASKSDLQGDGLRHPIVQFLKARAEHCRQHGLPLPHLKELMGSYLDASYTDGVPTYEERMADQKALALLAATEGLKSNQYRRKPYAAAVRARSKDGTLPPRMTPDAIRKRNEREAERLAGGKVGKRQLKRLPPDARSALMKRLCDEFTRLSAKAFEKLAVYVLSVAYGVRPEEGLHTGKPGDGQFDGFIWRRRFGREDIYIQATRSAVGNWKVGVFHDGLTLARLDPKLSILAILVTGSTVSNSARASAQSVGIRTIDGMELAEIMIDHQLGGSTNKGEPSIDHNFFSVEIDRVTTWSP